MTSLQGARSRPAGLPPAAARDGGARPDVAVLVYDFRGSGVVHQAIRIAREAAAAALDVEIWALRNSGPMRSRIPEDIATFVLGPETFDPRRALPRALDSAMLSGRLARALSQRRPAVLFSAGNHMHAFATAALAQARPRPATRLVGRASSAVLGVHGHDDGRPGRAALRRLSRAAQRPLFAGMHHVISVADELAGDLVAEIGLSRDRVTVIPNGVDIDAVAGLSAQPVDHPWFAPGEPPVLLGVGRLAYQKNFPLLITAFARARQARPMRLAIIGDGGPLARAALLQHAALLDVGEHVWLAGFDPNPYRYMRLAAALVVSSRWEGASNVVLEALACGCPVVASACPTGIAEVLGDGRWGPVAAEGDASDLARCILQRLREPRNAAALRARARDFEAAGALRAYVHVLREQVRLARSGPTRIDNPL